MKHLRLSTQVDKPGLNVLREQLGEQRYPREYMRASLNAISPTGIYAVFAAAKAQEQGRELCRFERLHFGLFAGKLFGGYASGSHAGAGALSTSRP